MLFTDIIQNIVSVMLILFVGINMWATWTLWGFAKKSQYAYPALNERAISATIKTIGSAILGLLGFNRIIGLNLPVETVLVLLMIAIVLQTLPPIVWVYYYKTGRFRAALRDLKIED